MKPAARILIATLAAAACSGANAGDEAFMTINGVPISQTTASMYADHLRASGISDVRAIQSQIREVITRRELLFEAAHQSGFDMKPDVIAEANTAYRKALAEAEATRQTIIVRRYVENFLDTHPATDANLRAIYDRMHAAAGTGQEYKVREVVVKNQAKANAVVREIRAGAKFDDALRDAGLSGPGFNRPESRWSSPGRFIKPVADAILRLKSGGVTDPAINADDGYHVLQVDATRPLKIPPFEEMKPMLAIQSQQEQVMSIIDNMRRSAVIRQ
ncbi:peptidylprolyl isomerase [Caballeronia sp. LP006]|uniref:peptidylprolyl isomerase n=1 Tax=Caballeronia sp. LP006 TaxID=3038552 RepID=UPI002865D769|nr:peptidylprolyl isomerase [Caballeronia sp. LP006]MDR5832372.1 peptidylprolyl isomerase [Caballeronia sp. LP006]